MYRAAVVGALLAAAPRTSAAQDSVRCAPARRATGSATHIFIPTSALVDLTRQIARREGYPPSDQRHSFVDLMEQPDHRPAWPGYVTAGFYWYSRVTVVVALNERTGQAVDPSACWEYDYPEVRAIRREFSRETGATPLPLRTLAEAFPCDSLIRRGPRGRPTAARRARGRAVPTPPGT